MGHYLRDGIPKIKEGEFGSRPSWDEYFMAFAIVASRRASCENVRAGSIFVKNKRIIGTGYNGTPPPVKQNCLDVGCRKRREGLEYEKSLGSGKCRGVHGEVNALGHLLSLDRKGVTLYTTIFPCHTCSKDLSSYEIGKVVFKRKYSDSEFDYTVEEFEEGDVELAQLDMSLERLIDIFVGLSDVTKFDIFSKEDFERGRKFLKSLRRK